MKEMKGRASSRASQRSLKTNNSSELYAAVKHIVEGPKKKSSVR